MKQPLDLPLDAVIEVSFLDRDGRKVELRVRNREKNEDEDGNATVRSGRTNYFVFPGTSGTDASWLEGASFRSHVSVSVPMESGKLSSATFLLLPHAHGHGHKH